MPIGFYLVASNKPVCLTCIQMTLRNTQMYMRVPVTFSRAASKYHDSSLSVSFHCCALKILLHFFKCHLFGSISPGLKLRLADFICFPACSMIAYSFLIMKYLICCRGWEGGDCFRKSSSLSKSRLFIHSAHLYNFYSDMIQDSQVCSDFL